MVAVDVAKQMGFGMQTTLNGQQHEASALGVVQADLGSDGGRTTSPPPSDDENEGQNSSRATAGCAPDEACGFYSGSEDTGSCDYGLRTAAMRSELGDLRPFSLANRNESRDMDIDKQCHEVGEAVVAVTLAADAMQSELCEFRCAFARADRHDLRIEDIERKCDEIRGALAKQRAGSVVTGCDVVAGSLVADAMKSGVV